MTLLAAHGVTVRVGARTLLQDVDLAVGSGRTVALVGASGAGKSTLLRVLLGLQPVAAGRVEADGAPLPVGRGSAARRLRARVQYVPQDPGLSLDPRWSVGRSIAEPWHRLVGGSSAQARRAVSAALEAVGLDPDLAALQPGRLSGGQAQRAAVARSLVTGPDLLLADEPTSALDPVRRDRWHDLLVALRRDRGLGLLLVSHDLAAVRRCADEVVVLDGGVVVERGGPGLVEAPSHPATAALVAAALPLPRGLTPRSACAAAARAHSEENP
ncbi:dipeptide/oligopeptide/nickel ABC transporter ATP-binding protein [Nocardioides sp.]|uniref:ABC transporter ATP-binding protein n=1 Tax=Nocardioides sp. TaxID=35761 RepID=UPI003515353B